MRVGIDLGTATTLIAIKGKGVVLREPTVIADCGALPLGLAVGAEALPILGREPAHLLAVQPVRRGAVGAPGAASELLRNLLKRAFGWRANRVSELVLTVPSLTTSPERGALLKAAREAGGRKVATVPMPVAMAHGADPQVARDRAVLIVDVGAGTTEVAAVAPDIVLRNSVRVGGNDFDCALKQHLRDRHALEIGTDMAQEIKLKVATAWPRPESLDMEVCGQERSSGLPGWVRLTSEEAREALARPLQQIAALTRSLLDQLPPSLSPDVLDRGLLMTGGGSLLHGLDRYLAEQVGLEVRVADDPVTCAVRGCLDVRASAWKED